MSTTKNKQAAARAAKRARFSSQQKSGGASPLVLIAGLTIVLALIGGAVLVLTRPGATAAEDIAASSLDLEAYPGTGQDQLVKAATVGHNPYPLAVAEDGAVRLPLSTFDDQKAHFYTYMHEGRSIEFFVLKSKDGVVRAAFNACDVCFQSKRGYRQEGDEMVCNNCGNRFPSNKINELRGGCNPSPLDRIVEGDTLVILVEDIIEGQIYF